MLALSPKCSLFRAARRSADRHASGLRSRRSSQISSFALSPCYHQYHGISCCCSEHHGVALPGSRFGASNSGFMHRGTSPGPTPWLAARIPTTCRCGYTMPFLQRLASRVEVVRTRDQRSFLRCCPRSVLGFSFSISLTWIAIPLVSRSLRQFLISRRRSRSTRLKSAHSAT
jgi:hypothetical protein